MSDTRRALLVAAVGVLALTASVAFAAVATAPEDTERTPRTAGRSFAAVEPLHERGVTGENVSVGVLEPTGFDREVAPLSGNVTAARAFGGDATVSNAGRTAHGTAAAATVARVAPDADLYLASFDGERGYRQAMTWLLQRDVDVVVAPESFYGKMDGGRSVASRLVTRAREEGVVVVTATGNVAGGHWEGRYSEERVYDGTLVFNGSARNYLVGDRRTVTLWLSWSRAHADENYTMSLYRQTGDGAELVARSSAYGGDRVPNQRIHTLVEGGRYFVVVRGPRNATGARLELESPTHDFEHVERSGSVLAPAAAHGAIAVGAYDEEAGRVLPYSSRGPTTDGRLGVDVVGPHRVNATAGAGRFTGTSAASSYVGGVVALLLDAAPGLTPADVERILERTARDVGADGGDVRSGYGLVRPRRAVARVTNGTA